jgi:Domain of unknown function (DUF927)
MIRVPAAEFAAMNFVAELGVDAVLYAGVGIKDHARAAIQLSSHDACRHRIYTHTGWVSINGQHTYLTGSGGIVAAGLDPSIEVRLDGKLTAFSLPSPPVKDELREAVRASIGLLDLAPDSAMVPVVGAVYRAVLASTDFGLHIFGPTGAGKSAVAAIAQQHYGAAFGPHDLPGNWSSTDNALEASLFIGKDALFVIDDLLHTGTTADVARLERTADRVFRAQANGSGRARMRTDGSLRPVRPPRGLVLSTGEESPRGQSLAARRADLELRPEDLDWDYLTVCQQRAGSGLYAQALSGFVQWVACSYESIQATPPPCITSFSASPRARAIHST